MNAKDTVTITKLKKISEMEDALAVQALREGLIPFYVRSMAIAEITASAAGLIESLNNEISTLKAQLAGTNTSSPALGNGSLSSTTHNRNTSSWQTCRGAT